MYPRDDEGLRKRLHCQINHILRTVPYYSNFDAVTSDPWETLGRLPVVTKSIIKNAYGDFISNEFSYIRSSLVQSLSKPRDPATMVRDRIDQTGTLISETSGSTGVPFRCPKSMADRIRLGKAIWWQRSKVDPRATPTSLYRFIHRGALGWFPFDPWRSDPEHIVALYADVSKSECRWLHASARMLLHHIDILERGGRHLRLPALRFIECSGEFLTDETKARLADYFGVEVTDQYGTIETLAISLTCRHGAHHVNNRNVIVEILDDENNPTPTGVPGRVVITSLQTKLLPFVRYATNDYAMLIHKTCDCGLGVDVIQLSDGRDFELIGGLANRTSGTRLFHEAIANALSNIGNCNLKYIRVVQTGIDEFVVKTNEITNTQAFCDSLRKIVSDSLGRPIRLRHVLATDAEMRSELRDKPCLFRRQIEPLSGSGDMRRAGERAGGSIIGE